jgi:hypothetical protein
MTISKGDMLDMFSSGNNFYFARMDTSERRDGVSALDVNFDFQFDCFVIKLHSADFDEVPLGMAIPFLEDRHNMMVVAGNLADDIENMGVGGRELLRNELSKYELTNTEE